MALQASIKDVKADTAAIKKCLPKKSVKRIRTSSV